MVSGGYEWPVWGSGVRAARKADSSSPANCNKINKLYCAGRLSGVFFSGERREISCERSALGSEWFGRNELLAVLF